MSTLMSVSHAGLVTSVGLDVATTCAALRCRLNNFVELGFWDAENEPVIGAPVPWQSMGAGIDKLAQMTGSAIRQALAARPDIDLAQTPLLLCLAEPERVGRLPALDTGLFRRLEALLCGAFHPAFHPSSACIAAGQTAVFLALKRAGELLDEGHPAVLIAAADTLLNRATIEGHLEQERLLATDMRAGFIPGEAAGALLVTAADPTVDVELLLYGLGESTDEATRKNGLPPTGAGGAVAIAAALAAAGMDEQGIALCVSDVSGEDDYFMELTLAQQASGLAAPLWLPAESLGETGSVIGCIQLAWMFEALKKYYLPDNSQLLLTSNDNGHCTALVAAFEFSESCRAKLEKSPPSYKTMQQGARHAA